MRTKSFVFPVVVILAILAALLGVNGSFAAEIQAITTWSIDIEKSTNGEDADDGPGPEILVGEDVTWEYVITNTGTHSLTNITVIDDQEGSITCPATELGPTESMTCTHYGTASLGQYVNLATVTGEDGSTTVTDSDPSHYFGLGLDFGDLPDNFGITLLEDDGARHSQIDPDLFFGTYKDLEEDGIYDPSGSALGDDYDNLGDEEGVYPTAGSNWSDGMGEVTIVVSRTVPVGGYVGCVTGWLDFQGGPDGTPNYSFDDVVDSYDEYIISNKAVVIGENLFEFPLPEGVANDASFFGRFRIVPLAEDGGVEEGTCTQDPLGYTGLAEGGEVEDMVFTFGPTAITLAGFNADSPSGSIQVLVLIAAIGLLSLVALTFGSYAIRKVKA